MRRSPGNNKVKRQRVFLAFLILSTIAFFSLKDPCDDFTSDLSDPLKCATVVKLGFRSASLHLFAPELSCLSSIRSDDGIKNVHEKIYDSEGCLLFSNGKSNRRICGVWTLPDGYIGRTGNQITQNIVQQFLAECIHYVFLPPTNIIDAGLSRLNPSTSCPSGLTFPRHWTTNDYANIRSHKEQRDFISKIAERQILPRLVAAAYFWERGDVLAAALEKQKWNRKNSASPLLSELISTTFLDVINGKTHRTVNNAAALEALSNDQDDVIFLHIRYGDLVDYAIRREILRRQGSVKFNEWADSERPQKDTVTGKLIEEFDKDMQDHPGLFGPNRYDWKYAVKKYNIDLINLFEYDCAGNDFANPPLSYFRSILSTTGPKGPGTWKKVFILTEPGNEDNPVIEALIHDFGASIVPLDNPSETLAMLMAAQTLVLSSSTFSQIGGLFGRAKVIHFPHAGLDTLRPDHGDACRLPLARDGNEKFRDLKGGPRIIYHDIYRNCINIIIKDKPDWVKRMQSVHGWSKETLKRCLQRKNDMSPFFLNSTMLIDFYRDEDCARVFMPSSVLHGTYGQIPQLCIDTYIDWSSVCSINS